MSFGVGIFSQSFVLFVLMSYFEKYVFICPLLAVFFSYCLYFVVTVASFLLLTLTVICYFLIFIDLFVGEFLEIFHLIHVLCMWYTYIYACIFEHIWIGRDVCRCLKLVSSSVTLSSIHWGSVSPLACLASKLAPGVTSKDKSTHYWVYRWLQFLYNFYMGSEIWIALSTNPPVHTFNLYVFNVFCWILLILRHFFSFLFVSRNIVFLLSSVVTINLCIFHNILHSCFLFLFMWPKHNKM